MIVLYEHPLSPYAQKNKIALREKGIEFEARLPVALGSGALPDNGFRDSSPRGEVPALVHQDREGGARDLERDDVRIFDSTIILEYLEDRFPKPALLPAAAAERARVRMLEEVMDTHYEPINWGLSEIRYFGRAQGKLAEQIEAQAAEQVQRFFSWLETELQGRTWFNGESFGWGDLSVVPYLNGSLGFGLKPAADSRLSDWLGRANQRPSVEKTRAEAANAAAQMSGVAKLVEQRRFRREYRDHRLEWMIRSGGLEVVTAGLERDDIRFTDFPPPVSRPS
jgi:glutathione S-transferase/RNA polymerase-associated protein